MGAHGRRPALLPGDCIVQGRKAVMSRLEPLTVRLSWARLLQRVFDLNLEGCSNCCGELKIIAAILEQPMIEKILAHLALQARAPSRAPACGQALLHAA